MTSNQFLSNDSVAVIGIMHRHQVYLYDAAEFRPPLDGEVWCMEGTHWTRSIFTWKGRRHVTLSQVDIEVSNAHKADRRWLGGVLKAAHETSEPWPGEVANRFREDW
jgi:hypothetical protein